MRSIRLLALLALVASANVMAAPVAQRAGAGNSYGGPSTVSSMGPTTYGLGVSTLSLVPGDPTITGLINMGHQFSIQPLAAVHTTAGSFSFEAGVLGKYNVAGTHEAGLHLGGGVDMGSISGGAKSVFAVAVTALAGIHASLPGLSKIQFHLDAGPGLTIIDGNSAFALKPLSSALGLSVFYLF